MQARILRNLNFISDKELQKKGRGSCEEWEATVDGVRIVAVKWNDNRCVHTHYTHTHYGGRLTNFLNSRQEWKNH